MARELEETKALTDIQSSQQGYGRSPRKKRPQWLIRVCRMRLKLFPPAAGYLRRFRHSCVCLARLPSATRSSPCISTVTTHDEAPRLPSKGKWKFLTKLQFPSSSTENHRKFNDAGLQHGSRDDQAAPLLL